ncbi:hypothetical protein J2X19_001757 [Rhodoferax ferrireducens]|uniref:Uncharacterized protein n=1 Tax=Rhodoferax ferrireducens TaxID=192843 RepID=A0ABU2C6Y0_9BURK|nr:hypothetical protein [Rhodoferax ferrireducens]MDR7377099.1 hypothetical protein [Rhodoferax ferrireducens]
METEAENAKISAKLHEAVLIEHTIVDQVIRTCINGLHIDNTPANMVAQLYHFVHVQYLAALSNLLRLHLSESMGNTRKAVDATLTAYELILFPEKLPMYLAREWHFQTIKSRIERARKGDPTKYPLAAGLLELHDIGSQYGAHADVSSFIHRMKRRPHEDSRGIIQNFVYFQVPESQDQGDAHYVNLFHNFLLMTRVFDPFTEKYAPINFEVWRADRDRKLKEYTEVGMELLARIRKHHAEEAAQK